MINHLLEELEEYKDIEWVSSSNVRTKIVDMSDDYLLNALKKVSLKAIIAQTLEYVEEIQMYEGQTYSTWVRYFYSQYLYRKHESIVVEESIPANSLSNQDKQEYVSGLEFLDVNYNQSNNGIYQIS